MPVTKPGNATKVVKTVAKTAKTAVNTTKKVVNQAKENKKIYDKRVDDLIESDRRKEAKDLELSKGKYSPVTLRPVVCSKSAKGLAMIHTQKRQAEIDALDGKKK